MPSYPHLLDDTIPWDVIPDRVGAMDTLGVPYDASTLDHADDVARTQAKSIADKLAASGGPKDLADKEVVALIAYMQRLGVDIKLAGGAK